MKRINRIYTLIIIAIFAISNSGFVNAQTTEFEVDGTDGTAANTTPDGVTITLP